MVNLWRAESDVYLFSAALCCLFAGEPNGRQPNDGVDKISTRHETKHWLIDNVGGKSFFMIAHALGQLLEMNTSYIVRKWK